MSAETYRIHGLVVRSEIPIEAARGCFEEPDVDVRLAEPAPIPDVAPAGVVLAGTPWTRSGYTIARAELGTTIRYYGVCDFVISLDGRDVRVHLEPGTEAGMASILLAGSVMAVLLALRGEAVLHASALARGDDAIAFVGGCGAGKSTLAAVLCGADWSLVTDDVLRLDLRAEDVSCFPGGREIRLRQDAAWIAQRLEPACVAQVADGRAGVIPRFCEDGRLPLRAIFLPVPSRSAPAVGLLRLSQAAALVELCRYPRTIGWRTQELGGAQFALQAEIARRIPVFRAEIPWGPPPGDALAARLSSAAFDAGAVLGTSGKARAG